jgi:NadR type nicotinamide-nucleotide adenylyltransferase
MIKIAILGPESTGKTALAQQLAEHFNAPWVPEYAREYVENLTSPYTYDDVCCIARKQIEQEKSFVANPTSDFVFFDTELIITKVWFSYCFKTVPDFVTEQLESGFFDLYLLCEPDLPWQPDAVREHGDDREFFFEWYKREIEQTSKPYVIVNGIGEQRLQHAIEAIQNQLNK